MSTGGCLCRQLRYEVQGEPVFAGYCCCEDCRKASGSGFIPYIGVTASTLSITGDSRSFASPAWNGNMAIRNFCAVCGGLVFGGERGTSARFTIYAGSLDDPSWFRPTAAIFTCRLPDWVILPPGLTLYDTMPG